MRYHFCRNPTQNKHTESENMERKKIYCEHFSSISTQLRFLVTRYEK